MCLHSLKCYKRPIWRQLWITTRIWIIYRSNIEPSQRSKIQRQREEYFFIYSPCCFRVCVWRGMQVYGKQPTMLGFIYVSSESQSQMGPIITMLLQPHQMWESVQSLLAPEMFAQHSKPQRSLIKLRLSKWLLNKRKLSKQRNEIPRVFCAGWGICNKLFFSVYI